MTTRRIGPRARASLHFFESFRERAYRCPAGIPTIGWGNTFYPDGRPVRMGDRVTRAEGDALFEAILPRFEDGVHRALHGAPATAAQFGGLVGLAWNVGIGAVAGSTLMRLHRAGQIAEAAAQFPRWNRSAGRVEHGLVRRRAVERLLYLNDLSRFDEALALYKAGRAAQADAMLGIAR